MQLCSEMSMANHKILLCLNSSYVVVQLWQRDIILVLGVQATAFRLE